MVRRLIFIASFALLFGPPAAVIVCTASAQSCCCCGPTAKGDRPDRCPMMKVVPSSSAAVLSESLPPAPVLTEQLAFITLLSLPTINTVHRWQDAQAPPGHPGFGFSSSQRGPPAFLS